MSMWSTFATAIETELLEGNELTGVSGLTHRVDAIGVDDRRSRLVVASAEPNPRVAALMQVDIQATMPGTMVIVARPIAVNFPSVDRRIAKQLGTATIDINAMSAQLKHASERPGENVAVQKPIRSSLQQTGSP